MMGVSLLASTHTLAMVRLNIEGEENKNQIVSRNDIEEHLFCEPITYTISIKQLKDILKIRDENLRPILQGNRLFTIENLHPEYDYVSELPEENMIIFVWKHAVDNTSVYDRGGWTCELFVRKNEHNLTYMTNQEWQIDNCPELAAKNIFIIKDRTNEFITSF